MGWCTTFDLDRFAAAAGGYLRSRAAANTLLLSAVQAARSAHPARPAQPAGRGGPVQATAAEPGSGWLFGWWEPPGGGEPRGVFLHDPAAPLLISGLVPEMAASLAATMAKMGRPVLGVDAPTEAADAFAAAWSQRSGTGVRVHRHCHVYRLAGPVTGTAPAAPPQTGRGLPGAGAWPPPQPPAPPGRFRVATDADQPLLADWLAAFANETAERIGSPRDLAAELISYGGAVFWEAPQRPGRPWGTAHFLPGSRNRDASHRDAGYRDASHRDAAQAREQQSGQPTALATLTRPVAGTVRISMLYTPPERRHSGYASALTMAVSRAVLSGPASPGPVLPGTAPDGGRAGEIVMITDRNRPNLWATRLGFQLVSERAVLRFGPVTGPVPRLTRTGPMPRLPTGPLPRVPRLRG
jgi:hypothetical protein